MFAKCREPTSFAVVLVPVVEARVVVGCIGVGRGSSSDEWEWSGGGRVGSQWCDGDNIHNRGVVCGAWVSVSEGEASWE